MNMWIFRSITKVNILLPKHFKKCVAPDFGPKRVKFYAFTKPIVPFPQLKGTFAHSRFYLENVTDTFTPTLKIIAS
jgi:hypothetical protein